MRNWNFVLDEGLGACDQFSAYLWGIETRMAQRAGLPSASFSAYLWGIETRITPRQRDCLWSFQRTYEELKHVWAIRCHLSVSVFSVPMRNWNSGSRPPAPPRQGFSAYLWGIETVQRSLCDWCWWRFQRTYEELKLGPPGWTLQDTWFSAYLWGIETPTAVYNILKYWEVFSVPMRNWNEETQTPSRPSPAFSAYLWGIETR